MDIVNIKTSDLIAYENNPRNNEPAVDKVAESIKEFGFKIPCIITKDNVIVAGHTRRLAAIKLGLEEVPCIIADDLTPEQIKAFRLVDNKTSEFAEWDLELLEQELAELTAFDMSSFGFDESIFEDMEKEMESDLSGEYEENKESLADKFIVPPFSILDTRQGYWQDRKNIWKKIIKSDIGREEGLLGQGLLELAQKHGSNLTGTSIFDPVLTEILINWFCPAGGKVLDPFAGGSVRGLISVLLGNEYTGIDLREEQIKANYKNFNDLKTDIDLNGNDLKKPNWICEDSMNLKKVVKGEYDFMLTCPPYADLEVYSDDPRDISNMEYGDFKKNYSEIIKQAVDRLKDNAFVAIVVGEVRDKHGYYYNFVGDTIQACLDAGLKYYNECILINMAATLALRAGRQFTASRKIGKSHQNVLIFLKGNEKEIELQNYDYEFDEVAE